MNKKWIVYAGLTVVAGLIVGAAVVLPVVLIIWRFL